VTDCILWGDSATNGPEVYVAGGKLTSRNCDIQGSGGSGAQWNPALGTDGGGNIMADPLFVNALNPAGADGLGRTADDGLALSAASPCINAGLATGAPAQDILGRPRDTTPDIGAYEYQTPKNTTAMWTDYP